MKKKIRLFVLIFFAVSSILLGLFFQVYSEKNNQLKETKKSLPESKLSKKEELSVYQDISKKTSLYDSFMSELYPIEDVNKLSSKEKTLFLLRSSNNSNKEINIEQLQKKLNNFFDEFDIYKGQIKDKKGKVLYNYKKGVYTFAGFNNSVLTPSSYEISSDGTNKRWTVKKKLYYFKFSLDENSYIYTTEFYANQNDKEPMLVKKSKSNSSSLTKEEFEKVKSTIATVTYNFVKKNGTYILKSVDVS